MEGICRISEFCPASNILLPCNLNDKRWLTIMSAEVDLNSDHLRNGDAPLLDYGMTGIYLSITFIRLSALFKNSCRLLFLGGIGR